jgi:hypothetical protein
MTLTEFCRSLDAQLSSLSTDLERLESMARAISQAFKVTPEEVAIFSYDDKQEILTFLWPLRLKSAGALPLSSHNALAIKTIRENRAFLDNSFSSTPHASIFEHVRLGAETPPLPIQKIMSAPLSINDEIKGVVEVSMKGLNNKAAGNDFTSDQLLALTKIADVVARYI